MSVSLSSSSSTFLFKSTKKCSFSAQSISSNLLFKSQRCFPHICASSSVNTGLNSELDAISGFSEIVPDTVIFDDFERFPPTAATVSSSLLLGICSLPDTIFRNAVDKALGDSDCYTQDDPSLRLSCFYNKALVNVGADLAKLVPGRVSTEVDARLAYDTQGIIKKLAEWNQLKFASAMGPATEELLGAGLDGYIKQTKRVEELFGKIWPPPNV
ncbi:hypothetical protein AQUCO_01300698v1 [Aquilegia coerulea]|uniref:Transaldolase n=1 Tax=Aquilegia coerulea TaxID=218851 RepID=A0A2G5E338_AQUCA|nr:hypothetical protein AQUCO_01300698v1 [Aquilegia coerulea]